MSRPAWSLNPSYQYTADPQREDTDRPTMVRCAFCPAMVDHEQIAAARHLLYACPRASTEAKDTAAAYLARLHRQEDRAVQARLHGEGEMPPGGVTLHVKALRAQRVDTPVLLRRVRRTRGGQ